MQIVGYSPRPSQRKIFESSARFLIVDAGRRWGKTLTGINWLLKIACERPGEIWWVAPVYSQSKIAFRMLLSAARNGGADAVFRKISESEMRLEMLNGASITFKSADNPENLRGEGLVCIVVDEAARVKREVWEEVLRPAVSDTAGKVLFLSTPKGKNWFYELWLRGQPGEDPKFSSWKFPTWDNTKISEDEIAHAQESLPQDIFAQEYAAEFLDNAAGVFRRFREAIGSQRKDPEPGRAYFAGLDLARLTDFTVLTILNDKGEQVFFDRFNVLDWAVQKQRIIYNINRYNARLLLDSTGIGDPIFDDLIRAGLDCEGYKFDNLSKKKLIEALMLAFEQQKIKILNEPVQINELDIFEYRLGKNGQIYYSAPAGYHDDCVIALALANWALQNRVEYKIWRI